MRRLTYYVALLVWLSLRLPAHGQRGVITSLAGSNWVFPSGVAALEAPFGNVSGVAVDSQNNVYVADNGSDQVFLVHPDGTIQALAGNGRQGYSGDGGPATAASLRLAANGAGGGLAVDGAGNLYIADTSNHCIRQVSPAGIIMTVAGVGRPGFDGDGGPATAASLLFPSSVSIDALGNLYIADTANQRIRQVASNGTIKTVAGGGACSGPPCGFSGDGGLATAAMLYNPSAVVVDAAGNLFIADTYNNRIRQVTPDGIIRTMAANGPGFQGHGSESDPTFLRAPTSIAIDSAGNLYTTDAGYSRVQMIDPGGVITTVAGGQGTGFAGDGGPATSALFDSPAAIAVDGTGNLLIADKNNGRIRRVAAIDHGTSTLAGNGNFGFAGDGGPAAAASLSGPTGVAADSVGNIYVMDSGNRRIRQITVDGVINTVAGNGTSGTTGDGGPALSASFVNGPNGITVDVSGNLYIADVSAAKVRKVSPDGLITAVAGSGGSGFSGDGGAATWATLTHPYDVAFDRTGNLFIADTYNFRVRKVSPDGIINTIGGNGTQSGTGDGGPATAAGIYGPIGIAVDSGGNVFVADVYENRVRKISTNGLISTVAGNGSRGFSGDGGPAVNAALNQPWGIAVDPAGDLFIADAGNLRIRAVTPRGIISTVAGNGSSGNMGDGGSATSATFTYPVGIALDPSGNLLIADSGASRVRQVAAIGDMTPAPPCANIAGNWNASESGEAEFVIVSPIESDDFTNDVGGKGSVTIAQTGCQFQYDPIGLSGLIGTNLTPAQAASLRRSGTIDGNTVTVTGLLALVDTVAALQSGLTFTQISVNKMTGTGQVTGTLMTLVETGTFQGSGTYSISGQTGSFALTVNVSSRATFNFLSGPAPIDFERSRTQVNVTSARGGTDLDAAIRRAVTHWAAITAFEVRR